jgi:hypothetical protein
MTITTHHALRLLKDLNQLDGVFEIDEEEFIIILKNYVDVIE